MFSLSNRGHCGDMPSKDRPFPFTWPCAQPEKNRQLYNWLREESTTAIDQLRHRGEPVLEAVRKRTLLENASRVSAIKSFLLWSSWASRNVALSLFRHFEASGLPTFLLVHAAIPFAKLTQAVQIPAGYTFHNISKMPIHHLMIGTWTPPGAIFTVAFDDEKLTLARQEG